MQAQVQPATKPHYVVHSFPTEEKSCRPLREHTGLRAAFATTRDSISNGSESVPTHYRKGQTILCEGEPSERYFEIVRGVVRAYRILSDGRRQIVNFLFPGEVFGLGLDGTYEYSADAVMETAVHGIGWKAVDRLAIEQPALSARLRDSVYQELRAAQDHIVLLGRKTASERVASFLLSLSRKGEPAGRDRDMVWVPMSQCDIADYLGLTTETVNRVVSHLRENGTIRVATRSLIHVERRHQLEEMANAA
jgi:CRP-like cAMP-binding protein